MQEEACRHTLSALHTMLRHAVHRALSGHTPLSCASPPPWCIFSISRTMGTAEKDDDFTQWHGGADTAVGARLLELILVRVGW